MKLLRFLLVWGGRLPLRFSLPFLGLVLLFYLVVSWLLWLGGETSLADLTGRILSYLGIPKQVLTHTLLKVFLEGLVAGTILFTILLLAYNLAALLYRRTRAKPQVAECTPYAPPAPQDHPLDNFQKIGIVLAGGGAKGAYQAGAMKAIYEFLEERHALQKIAMIAGTSIGSWNAMFWLADLIKAPGDGSASPHEAWWRSISIERLIEFDTYWPLRRNSFLRPTPWQELFRGLFSENPAVRGKLASLCGIPGTGQEPPIHFYFTRANVARGHLEFATNWAGLHNRKRPNFRTTDPHDQEPMVRSDCCEVIEEADAERALMRMEQAVFASMDLPPLFPYVRIKGDMAEWFEDGGVVDNLPIWFGTQIEECDLLFVLPLNASFTEPVDHTSVVKRLFRVMDVRQGVLERNAFKLAYLYNELTAAKAGAAKEALPGSLAARVARRVHKPAALFAICPGPPLAIGTTEFWKPQQAGEAFELMYAETKYELRDKFREATNPDWIRMAIVDPNGGRTYFDDF
jgi:predicted acylesterase/phospholipase RssA